MRQPRQDSIVVPDDQLGRKRRVDGCVSIAHQRHVQAKTDRSTTGRVDTELGLHTVLGHYYYPGFHEPGTNISVGINKGVWESFDDGDRRLIEAVAASEYARSLAEFNTKNALALQKLRDEGTIKILKFDDSLLKVFRTISKDVVAEIGSADELAMKIYASYQQFRGFITNWSDIAERAVLNSRGLS